MMTETPKSRVECLGGLEHVRKSVRFEMPTKWTTSYWPTEADMDHLHPLRDSFAFVFHNSEPSGNAGPDRLVQMNFSCGRHEVFDGVVTGLHQPADVQPEQRDDLLPTRFSETKPVWFVEVHVLRVGGSRKVENDHDEHFHNFLDCDHSSFAQILSIR